MYVAEPHQLLRYGVVRALHDSDDFRVVGESADIAPALRVIDELEPEVAIVGERLVNEGGLEWVERVALGCNTRVLLLGQACDSRAVYDALAHGAAGYIPDDADAGQLLALVNAAACDEPMLPVAVQRMLLAGIRNGNAAGRRIITRREREILALLADGMPASQIALQLHVSLSTVKKHLHHVYDKLEVRSSAAAVAVGFRSGLLS